MAIGVTNLATGSSTANDTEYTLPSGPTFTADRLQEVAFSLRSNNDAGVVSLTGAGRTWVVVERTDHGNQQSAMIFRSMADSSDSGDLTFTTTETMTAILWSIDESDDVDTSGDDGAGAVGVVGEHRNTSNATSVEVTLGSFADATNNVTYGLIRHSVEEVHTPGSGFTELSDHSNSDGISLMTEWKTGEDTSVDGSWATSSRGAGVANEIIIASAGPQSFAPSSIAVAVSVQALSAAPSSAVSLAPSPLAIVSSIQAPALAASGVAPITLGNLTIVTSVNAPALAGSGVAAITLGNLTIVVSVGAPSIGAGAQEFTPSPLAIVSSIQATALAPSSAVAFAPSPLAIVGSVNAPALAAAGAAPITLGNLTIVTSVNAPALAGSGVAAIILGNLTIVVSVASGLVIAVGAGPLGFGPLIALLTTYGGNFAVITSIGNQALLTTYGQNEAMVTKHG